MLLAHAAPGVSCRYFPGPYDAYMEAKATAALTAGRQIAALDKQKAHIQASIAAAEKQARQVGARVWSVHEKGRKRLTGCTGTSQLKGAGVSFFMELSFRILAGNNGIDCHLWGG